MDNYISLAEALGIQGYIHGSEFRARCPMHQDTNPSFSLNVETGLWICFSGCGTGNFIRLVEVVLNASPQEAYDWVRSNGRGSSVEQISRQLGTMLGQSPILNPEQFLDDSWYDRYNLLSGKVMPLWFLNRGFTWKTINDWDIRYDPVFDAVLIPVFWEDELVGTIARNNSKWLPKYQNSPGLPRSEILFGEISKASNEIIICEGVLDALWLWQLGYNAVALLGTFLADKQVDILRRYRFGEIILCLDNDEAGYSGTKEAIKKLTSAGWLLPQISIIRFPEDHKDAQDCDTDTFADLYLNKKGVIHGQLAT